MENSARHSRIVVLIDHNIEWQATLLWSTLRSEGWLGQTIREENTPTSLPVLTISQEVRLRELEYRTRCAERLLEIVLDVEYYLGVGRIFIP